MKNKLNISSCITLNDGNSMPLFGLGVWAAKPGKETYDATLYALKKGYRHIDTAEMYGNENDVGNAIRDSGIGREKILSSLNMGDADPTSLDSIPFRLSIILLIFCFS